MYDAPIMMYGPRGWADLDDYRLVRNDSEAEAAARDGYFRAGEEAREDLVAAGKWHRLGHPSLVSNEGTANGVVKDSLTAGVEESPVVSDEPAETGHNAPKRRGRPPRGA